MKTTVSVPDDVFAEAERLARRLKKSRSQMYSEALAEYVARHDEDRVTEQVNAALDAVGEAARDRGAVEARVWLVPPTTSSDTRSSESPMRSSSIS